MSSHRTTGPGPSPGPSPLSFDAVSDSSGPSSRHHHFYFKDGTVILRVSGPLWLLSLIQKSHQVRNILFKIHRHFLTTYSPVFRDLFTLNSTSSTEGMNDRDPIVLDGDDPVDFCRLLYLWYPKYVRFYPLTRSTNRK